MTGQGLQAQESRPLEPGMIIRSSTTITPGRYIIPGGSNPAVRIAGEGITVDFQGAELVGSLDVESPDQFEGTGILIEPGSNVTLRGAVVRGFKVAVRAENTPGLAILDSDLSYNWRQRLKSTIEREHLDDWMSYHNNEDDEWLRFGAAIYLRGCDGCRIENVRVTGGQNGIMLTDVNDSLIQGNEITFNSSIGVGMYRSSRNRVVHNLLDFNVRGYSHGVYNRGQDSAAILVYEQSNDNEFGYNSATHSGDGFFLWAGQTTMDTGEGGCNGNIIHHNDFSFAPTNGIEITFSSNEVRDNYIEGCWHGIWGGYSFDTVIENNTFVDNEEHIAIEHGQDISVVQNLFVGGDEGIRLWERETQPADWGYSQARDVRSRDYTVRQNRFLGVGEPLNVERTTGLVTDANEYPETWVRAAVDRHHPRDRAYILVDEWGPHDFRSPVLWPRSPRKDREQWFEIVGPPGRWTLTATTGVDSVSATEGAVGDSIRVWRSVQDVVDLHLEATYVGGAVTDRFGRRTEAGEPFVFEYGYFFVPIDWTVDFWRWDPETSDPRTQEDAYQVILSGEPEASLRTVSLEFGWYREPIEGLPPNHFATRSEGRVSVPAGRYVLDITSDDGVRVWVDDVMVHEDWTWHAPKQELVELELGGDHVIRIDHFEIDGYATLMADLRRLED